MTWCCFSGITRFELCLLACKTTTPLPRSSLLRAFYVNQGYFFPFEIFFPTISVSPAKKGDYWNLCLIFIFCLILDILPCGFINEQILRGEIAHSSFTTSKTFSSKTFSSSKIFLSKTLFVSQDLDPQALASLTGPYIYFCLSNPIGLLKVLLAMLPLSIFLQSLTRSRLKIGTCTKSITTCRVVDSCQ